VCTIDTSESAIQTFVGAYTGGGYGSLRSESVAYDSIRFDAFKGVSYQIFVDGSQGATGSIRLQLTVAPQIVGLSAPSWTLRTPTGTTVRSADFAGKVILLDFWATWCGYCLKEIPDFVALQSEYGPDGFAVVGVSVDDTDDIVRSFMQTSTPTINYTVVMADDTIEDAFGGITGYPTTFVIDRNNIVRQKFIGQRSRTTFVNSVAPFLYGKLELSGGSSWMLRWRPDGAPILEHTPSLSAPVWSRWMDSPQLVDGMNVLQLPTGGTRFFRLKYNY
jgi:thiol-disulfide isomerase/thioredoxin